MAATAIPETGTRWAGERFRILLVPFAIFAGLAIGTAVGIRSAGQATEAALVDEIADRAIENFESDTSEFERLLATEIAQRVADDGALDLEGDERLRFEESLVERLAGDITAAVDTEDTTRFETLLADRITSTLLADLEDETAEATDALTNQLFAELIPIVEREILLLDLEQWLIDATPLLVTEMVAAIDWETLIIDLVNDVLDDIEFELGEARPTRR